MALTPRTTHADAKRKIAACRHCMFLCKMFTAIRSLPFYPDQRHQQQTHPVLFSGTPGRIPQVVLFSRCRHCPAAGRTFGLESYKIIPHFEKNANIFRVFSLLDIDRSFFRSIHGWRENDGLRKAMVRMQVPLLETSLDQGLRFPAKLQGFPSAPAQVNGPFFCKS